MIRLLLEHGAKFELFEESDDNRLQVIQKAAAAYVGGKPEEVTDSTTVGLALVYHGLRLRPQDEVLATTHDHFVHHEAIRAAVENAGASTRRAVLYDNPASADPGQMVERLRKAIRRNTRVVSLTWVHSSTGVKLPSALSPTQDIWVSAAFGWESQS
jgi:selenocysteine lyase/cysteine desulfurase